ncbi:MAG: hypothetical protein R2788_04680 [Saprospiraceae bacterium]
MNLKTCLSAATIPLSLGKTTIPNGVTTYDIVVTRHILSIQPMDDPYKLIAADINNSGSITTFDIVQLRKLILGVYQNFPDNNSWRFVRAGYVFPNPATPLTRRIQRC